MAGMIEVYDDLDVKVQARCRSACKTVGATLMKHYPKHAPWLVSHSGDGTMLTFICGRVSRKYGMTLRTNRPAFELERLAIKFGGEMLERHFVSRESGEFGHLKRNVYGDAATDKKGIYVGKH